MAASDRVRAAKLELARAEALAATEACKTLEAEDAKLKARGLKEGHRTTGGSIRPSNSTAGGTIQSCKRARFPQIDYSASPGTPPRNPPKIPAYRQQPSVYSRACPPAQAEEAQEADEQEDAEEEAVCDEAVEGDATAEAEDGYAEEAEEADENEETAAGTAVKPTYVADVAIEGNAEEASVPNLSEEEIAGLLESLTENRTQYQLLKDALISVGRFPRVVQDHPKSHGGVHAKATHVVRLVLNGDYDGLVQWAHDKEGVDYMTWRRKCETRTKSKGKGKSKGKAKGTKGKGKDNSSQKWNWGSSSSGSSWKHY